MHSHHTHDEVIVKRAHHYPDHKENSSPRRKKAKTHDISLEGSPVEGKSYERSRTFSAMLILSQLSKSNLKS